MEPWESEAGTRPRSARGRFASLRWRAPVHDNTKESPKANFVSSKAGRIFSLFSAQKNLVEQRRHRRFGVRLIRIAHGQHEQDAQV